MKTYNIQRLPEGVVAEVEEPEQPTYPLKHIVYHSPTGFNYGYGGSGVADLALSILADHLGETRKNPKTWDYLGPERFLAFELYQAFKWKFLSSRSLPDEFTLTSDDIAAWIESDG